MRAQTVLMNTVSSIKPPKMTVIIAPEPKPLEGPQNNEGDAVDPGKLSKLRKTAAYGFEIKPKLGKSFSHIAATGTFNCIRKRCKSGIMEAAERRLLRR